MAGIYLHIPFCKQACYYCNFHFSTSLKSRNDFVTALLKETELQKEYLSGEDIETIYFGGGTPSLLADDALEQVIEKLFHSFTISSEAEITVEANPDDISPKKIKNWKKAGVNRLSIGVQSFFDEDLRWMNRAHNSSQSIYSIETAIGEGLPNISIDLIYGTPTLPDDHWKRNVEQAISLNIAHLSCYALTIEPNTALKKMIFQKKTQDINPEDQARQFLLLMQWMEKAGFEHYEISNFSLPGKMSRHNTSYWQGKKYLGLGPSAHSYDGLSRQWNVSNNMLYIRSLEKNELLFEKEILTPVQSLNEYIMTSLRTISGIDLRYVSKKFGEATRQALKENSQKHIRNLRLEDRNSSLVLSMEGKLFADGIAADLFFPAGYQIPVQDKF